MNVHKAKNEYIGWCKKQATGNFESKKSSILLLLHPFNALFFQDYLGKPATKKYTILNFTAARDDEVAVASAGSYANHLHLTPER